MKNFISVLLFVTFLFSFSACSKDDSPSEPESQSDVKGVWGINMEQYSGMSLIEKLDVYLTVDESSGSLSGRGTVSYTNNGTNSTQFNIEHNVSGYYRPYESPNILVRVAEQVGAPPTFTFSGDWDEFGVNFKGQVTISYGGQIYTLNDQSYYKRKD